ncbi:MAG: hypothetical protein IKK21_02800 [Clostridia bacterium]|nr:hypothetical protein [Clostridia bacterium]
MNHEQHKPTAKGVLQTVAILLVCLTVFMAVNQVVMNKDSFKHIMVYDELKAQEWDVIFAGSSHMNNALYPVQIWEEQGFASYNNAQTGEILPVSYYTIKSAIETYHPKIVVLDMYMVYHNSKTGNLTWMHKSLDRMPLINRVRAIVDLLPAGRWKEFLFPVTLYHDRWKSLGNEDFVPGRPSVTIGAVLNFTVESGLADLAYEVTPPEVKSPVVPVALDYLDRIVALCKKTNTELVLVALPYCTSSEVEGATHDMSLDEARLNWLADYAAQHGLHYVNYFHLMDELGFDFGRHLYNYSHMNYLGGEIITRHLGQYLADNFDLADHRGEAAYAPWDAAVPKYRKLVDAGVARMQP